MVACACAFASAASANPFGAPGSLADPSSLGGAFGQSVSISADGAVAVVGEPNDAGGAGAALVYTNADGVWAFAQRLTPTGEIGAGHFGAAVSMDGTGQTLLVGAPDDHGGVGSAWAFALADGVWTQQNQLLGGRAETDAGSFGASVAVASGGTLALVGAPMSDAGEGQVFTFTYDMRYGWDLFQRMDRAGVPAGAHFGASIALPGNGGAALVGAPNAAGGDGIVYPYSYFGLESPYWIDGTPIQSPVSQANFGASVTQSLGGSDEFIGAPMANGGAGAVYEYRPSGMQEATFVNPSGTADGHFGASVAIAAHTEDELLVGAPGENAGAGAAYDFDASHNADWTRDGAAITPPIAPIAGDGYGSSVAVAANGTHALIGAPGAGGSDGAATHVISLNITAPGAPMFVNAAPGVEQADVSWSAPYTDGGSPISGYTVTASPDGLTCRPAQGLLGCTISGLVVGRSYTFTVTATNHFGTSVPSDSSAAITPQAPPGDGGSGAGDGSGAGGSNGLPGGTGGSSGGAGGSPGGAGGSSGGAGGSPAGAGGSSGGGLHGGGGATRRDVIAPSRPSGVLRVIKRTRTSITVSWGPASDNTTVAGYRIYECVSGAWVRVGTTAATNRSFVRRGLRPRSRHRLSVRAVDAAGNLSAPLVGPWTATR